MPPIPNPADAAAAKVAEKAAAEKAAAEKAAAEKAAAEAPPADGEGKAKKAKRRVLSERKYPDGRLVCVVTDGVRVWKEGAE